MLVVDFIMKEFALMCVVPCRVEVCEIDGICVPMSCVSTGVRRLIVNKNEV